TGAMVGSCKNLPSLNLETIAPLSMRTCTRPSGVGRKTASQFYAAVLQRCSSSPVTAIQENLMNAYQTALTASLLLVVAACSKVTLRDDDHKEAQAPMEGCVADLDFAAAFLLDNDAGIRGMGWTAYPSLAEEAFQRERTSAAMAESVPECTAALNRVLQSVRKGHIGASSS